MKKKAILAALSVIALMLSVALPGFSGTVGTTAGFEDDDGNLAPATATDWNSFAPTSWQPSPSTTPTRTTSKTASGWQFKGLEDWQASGDDSGFAGGTKQDADCPTVISHVADNKADLKRIYLASKTGSNGHTYLMLAWVRIPQNTTSPSAHVAFEFNKNSPASPCGGTSDGLVHRQAGDMLIVYDFEGGSTDVPTLSLKRWTTTASDSCDISNDSPPCWGVSTTLAAGTAEAKVNTFGSVSDSLAAPALTSTTGTSVTETLGTSEFGEAGIDLTNAGVFTAGTCSTFGKAYGVSRTSGNSGTAQMKDLVGPGDFNLTNCGEIKIIKRTDPRGLNQNFSYTSTIPNPVSPSTQPTCTGDTTPSAFTLNDSGNSSSDNAANTEDCTNVAAGSYSVTEGSDPPNFSFESLTCTSSGTGTSTTTSGKVASITLAGGGVVTCVYVNKQNLGAIKVTKTYKHAASGPGDHPQSGVSFTVNGVTKQTDANGQACFDGLAFGSYTVHETVPAGYDVAANDQSVTVDNSATCADATYVGETVSFHNTPLTDLSVSVNSQVDGGTSSTITCTDASSPPNTIASGSTGANGDGSASATDLEPGTYTCTVVIDP